MSAAPLTPLPHLDTAIAHALCRTMGRYYSEPCHVAQSTLPGAGLGLFAFADIPEGAYLLYHGAIMSHTAAAESNSQYIAAYPTEGADICVDAAYPICCFARYANDPIDEHLLNCDFSMHEDQAYYPARLWLKTNQPIAAGEEIFVSYGKSYWLDHTHFESLPFETQCLLYETNRAGNARGWINNYYRLEDGRFVRGSSRKRPRPVAIV